MDPEIIIEEMELQTTPSTSFFTTIYPEYDNQSSWTNVTDVKEQSVNFYYFFDVSVLLQKL